jgi:cytochrome b
MRSDDPGAKVIVWDLPARVCHWGFALSVSASLVIAFRFNPENAIFKYHMLLGLVAVWFLAIRIGLGFFGGAQSRWRAFVHSPRRIARYFAEVIRWRTNEHEGLNPGTALFAPAVYLALVALIVTGFDADWVQTWHGWLSWGVIGLIGAHLFGLTLHALRHRELSPLAMVHGKVSQRPGAGPATPRTTAGVVLFAASALVAWWAYRYFDLDTSTLRLPFLPEISLPLIQKG